MSFTEVETAALLGMSVEDAAGWLAKAEQQMLASYGGQIQEWEALLQAEHGCWCGPGHRCEEDVDAMDSCCHHHDLAYNALGISAQTMWNAAAIVATRSADRALVSCVSSSPSADLDEATVLYREMLITIFTRRADLGDILAVL